MKYQTGNLEFDTSLFSLRRDGEQVDVEPQVFDLLVYLVEHRDRVVSREELLDSLWSGKVVTDSALTARLKAARRAVGDTGRKQAVIKTIHGRGYRFIADLDRPVASGTPVPAVETSEPVPSSQAPSIVVMPFTNMSSDPEQEYFSDGITEDIITELSRFRSLFVIARNSAFAFKGQSMDVKDIATKLGVRYLVEGSVRKAGDRVRITAQLVDAVPGNHLWADRYDRDLRDIFDVQDEVVRVVAGRITGVLEKVGFELSRRIPPENMTAFDLLLRGRWALNHSSEGNRAAIGFLEQAVAADENFAPAHAWLAYAYGYTIFTFGLDPEDAIRRARAHADRAVTLDSDSAEVNAAAAVAYLLSGEHALADHYSERAFAENPNDTQVLYCRGLVLGYTGRAAGALPCFAHIDRVDPLATDDTRNEGFCDCLFMLGEYERMLDVFRRWPDLPIHLLLMKGAALAGLGRLEEARATVDEYRRRSERKTDPARFVRYHVQMMARPADRQRWLDAYAGAGITIAGVE